ncbi:MAG: penicillin-binding transpeptidase domain-containing protein [bacterium]
MIFGKHNKKINTHSIDPDEIFMDTLNVSGLDTQQFEGVIERSITKKTIWVAGICFLLVGVIFTVKLFQLQIINGGSYLTRSENNRLHHTPIFADRGVIYDRNNNELAWNVAGASDEPFSVRSYINHGGFAHLIGYVGYPSKDTSGFFWQNEIIGKSGVEKKLNDYLSGENGQKIVELDAYQKVLTENMVTLPQPGSNVILTIDSGIQGAMYDAIKELAINKGFEGGAGVMMDVRTGEVLALTSYPEYDLNILSHGDDYQTISQYAIDERHVYLNRVLAGLYTPGSIVKPYLAMGALNEGIITPSTTVYSVGQVEIPNRYDPTKPQIFRDWKKGGHGVTDVYKAIAESVNTFFYSIGGGYKGQQGLGIARIDDYISRFLIGQKTGIDIDGEVAGNVPSPEWKKKVFPADGTWYQGDTYNSSIGQFGFQVTAVQMVRAVAAIANGGTLLQPYVTMSPKPVIAPPQQVQGIDQKWFTVIRDAMRKTVTDGTAKIVNVPYVHAAIKTGTAQVGAKNAFMNSWSTGFFPYENPRYAFVIVMEKARSTNETGATFVMSKVFDWMNLNTPNYFKP